MKDKTAASQERKKHRCHQGSVTKPPELHPTSTIGIIRCTLYYRSALSTPPIRYRQTFLSCVTIRLTPCLCSCRPSTWPNSNPLVVLTVAPPKKRGIIPTPDPHARCTPAPPICHPNQVNPHPPRRYCPQTRVYTRDPPELHLPRPPSIEFPSQADISKSRSQNDPTRRSRMGVQGVVSLH